MYKPCKMCKNTDVSKFIVDNRMDDVICTVCGCVQPWTMSCNDYTSYSEPPPTMQPTASEKKFLRLNEQMMIRVCPDEYKESKRIAQIDEYCDKLDLNESIKTKSTLLMKKYFDRVKHIRPQANLTAVCVILACQSVQRYINIKDMERFLGLENINNTIRGVCKVIGINQRSIILNSVPYLISMVGLPFKFEKKLRVLYKTICVKNPSMGAETRMALCLYKLYMDHMDVARYKGADIKYIADLTNTSENSLKTYITGKTKNALFQKAKRKLPEAQKNPKPTKLQK